MPRKYVVLICGMLIQICLGGVCAWTVFVPTLRQTYSLTTAQTQAIFGTAIAAWTPAMIPGGWALLRFGPRIVGGLAGLLFLCGGAISAASNGNFYLLWIGNGWLAGSAIGFGYVCALALVRAVVPDAPWPGNGPAAAGRVGSPTYVRAVGR